MSNPFADVERFEALRAAALDSAETFERYRRRESSAERRHMSRTVELRLAARVQRMVEVAIASSRSVLLVGPPGTGKTEILEQVVDKMDRNPARYGFVSEGVGTSWVTPEEEWTFEKLVLGETVVNGEIQSVEGDLLRAIRDDNWLVLDETNRADMDRVLGGVLTWLSGKRVQVGTWRDGGDVVPVYLEWTDRSESDVREVPDPPSIEYAAGSEWRVLGTYNAVDAQRVFRMGQALSRRFKHVPIPPASQSDFELIIVGHIEHEELLDWMKDRVTRLYTAHLEVEDAQLGPGLFVDIPAYVEKALQMAAYEGSSGAPPDTEPSVSEDEMTPISNGEDSGVIEESPTPIEGYDDTLLEELLTEAYLVSVGNVIAKYEPDILDDLANRIARHDALTPGNWAWVKDSLHAMRA